MASLHESCCRACGQYYTANPIVPNDRKTRRSSRISHTPSITLRKKQPLSSSNYLCGDCIYTVEMLAVTVALDDDESEHTSASRSLLKQQHVTSNNSSGFVSTEMDNTANCKGIGSCRSCTNTVAFTLATEISPSNLLCIDCLNATKLVAEPFDLDDDYRYINKSTPTSTERNDKDSSIVPHHCGSSSSATSISRSGYISSRIVSPEKASRMQSTSSTLCRTCNEREVPEPFMEYCKRCYALSFKSKPSDDKYEKKATTNATIPGRCRLCTGVVNNESHQYCLKCYTAKQKDDTKRIQKELLQKPPPKPTRHIPYECMDCGATIHDCSWKTQCPPCFAKIRDSVRRKPKLLRPPLRIGLRRKPKYRSYR